MRVRFILDELCGLSSDHFRSYCRLRNQAEAQLLQEGREEAASIIRESGHVGRGNGRYHHRPILYHVLDAGKIASDLLRALGTFSDTRSTCDASS